MALDVLESANFPGLSPFMNRYMTRTVATDLVAGKRSVFTYSKLCRALIVGFVEVPQRNKWVGGKMHVRRGLVGGPIQFSWPETFFNYMNESANKAGAVLGRMSERQQGKLADLMMGDIESVAKSEVFRAMKQDVEFSGRAAFDLKALNEPDEDEA